MKKIILLLHIFVSINLFSQNIKTYTGSRSISILNYNIEGSETYKYVEKSGDKIKTGPYIFTAEIKKSNFNSYTGRYEEGIAIMLINGNYKNDKPEEIWTSSITGNINSTELNIHSTCIYTNGMLNGKYSSKLESQEYNKKGFMLLTECTFKNNKIVGKYMLRAGTKGSIKPDGTCIVEFDKNGFINNEYYKNGFDLNNRNFNTYDTSLNAIFINDTLFITANKGYIDLNNGSFYNVSGIENDCFTTFQTDFNKLIMIFQVTANLPKIYVTREWVLPEIAQVESLIKDYDKIGNNFNARKLEYYLNLSIGNKLVKEEQYKNAQYRYLMSLNYKDDPEIRNKIVELQKLIEFDSLVSIAAIEFKSKQYNEAELLYQKALTIRSDKSIEGMLVKIDALNEKYNQLIVIAETEYKNENPEASKSNFEQALIVKPNEQYPKDFIRKIEDEKYNRLIKNAENEYKNENFETSKYYFEQALCVKPNHRYPIGFISKIDSDYANTLSTADSLFKLKDFDNSLLSFKQSLKYNSNNSKSKEKIRDIEKTNIEIAEVNIIINKKKTELEPVLGRVLKKVYVSVCSYFENKLSAEKDIFIALSIKNEFYNALIKIEALEVTKDKEKQRQLKDVETAEQYLKILGL